MEKSASTELDTYRQQNANILTPDIKIDGALSDFHKAVVEKVQLDSDPKTSDDVYYDNNAKGLVISGKGLSKLAGCAGIVWNFEQTRRTDNRSDKMYCSYQAVGGIKKPDGTIIWMKGEYDIDLEVLKEQLVEVYTAKAKKDKKDQAYIDYCVNRDLEQKRTHKVKLCETGARNRVIRALLGLKAKYTPKELSKPFVVARIVFQPDPKDPDVKKMMLAAAYQSITGIYGLPAPTQKPGPEDDYIDVPHETIEPDDFPGDQPEDDSPEESSRLDFENQSRDEQIGTLQNLMRKKGYDRSKLTHPLETFKETHRLKFFDALIEMPDDDIPF